MVLENLGLTLRLDGLYHAKVNNVVPTRDFKMILEN